MGAHLKVMPYAIRIWVSVKGRGKHAPYSLHSAEIVWDFWSQIGPRMKSSN